MIKILYSYNLIDNDNEYVSKMAELTSQVPDVQVTASLEEFWNPSQQYDYIFINWPDYLLGWKKNISDKELDLIATIILEFKKKNTKIIIIRHDIYPHSDKSSNAIRLYDFFNKESDIILHLGSYSLQDFKTRYFESQEQIHYIIPHILFENFNFSLDRKKLRSDYGLKNDDFFVFVPGNMRNYEEFKAGLKLYNKINKKEKKLHFQKVQTSFFPPTEFSVRCIVHYLKKLFLYRPKNITYGFTYLDTEKISELFTISDLVLIPRLDNLNSGNVTLSAQFQKRFIAIESGNITEWTNYLQQTLIPKNDLYNDQKINILEKDIDLAKKITQSSNDSIIINVLQKILK